MTIWRNLYRLNIARALGQLTEDEYRFCLFLTFCAFGYGEPAKMIFLTVQRGWN